VRSEHFFETPVTFVSVLLECMLSYTVQNQNAYYSEEDYGRVA